MPLDFVDRRTADCLANVIDDALELADECGWRYALAYLISKRVPSQIIQRLLSGGGRTRQAPTGGQPTYQADAYGWKGRNTEGMVDLFESLRERKLDALCSQSQAPRPLRSSVHFDDND
ncbi:hypothetical protein SAMN05518865_1032 [Duganella sp. CF458]|uniref:hypothetical protein n=1 Tax=Duganella sp. CF458 TaxID=1884368 RepID=UPI0008EF5CF3|nr:hypothetical protein [Duganella sp. CF458]SFF66248.1 hypothetical protein SAMN05518865_1032 [Duganella sp. CF458]